MRKVAVLGWYGHNNFGDELMLKGLRKLFVNWEVVPMSDVTTETVERVNVQKINDCDLFVLGGGDLIHGDRLFMNTPTVLGLNVPSFVHKVVNRLKVFDNVSWYHKIKVPKVVLGCGVNVNGFSCLEYAVVKQLRRFSYVGVRDFESFRILSNFPSLKGKVHLFYDLCFANQVNRGNNRLCKDFAVVVPTDRLTLSDKGVEEVGLSLKSKGWLTEKLRLFSRVVFIPFGKEDNDDYKTCIQLKSCVNGVSEVVFPEYVNLESVTHLIGGCKKVFSYRLHGLLLAFMFGKPYDFYPYHRKVRRVHETIDHYSTYGIMRSQHEEFNRMLDLLGLD